MRACRAPRRARIHRRVGLALEASGPQRHANALAHHFTQAGEPEDADRAIRYALQASEEATRMLAHEQAAEHYAAAIELLERFHPEDRRQRCRLLLDLRRGAVPQRRAAAGLGRVPRGGGARRRARRRRRTGPGRDRRLAALRPAPGGDRRGADRDARAGAAR